MGLGLATPSYCWLLVPEQHDCELIRKQEHWLLLRSGVTNPENEISCERERLHHQNDEQREGTEKLSCAEQCVKPGGWEESREDGGGSRRAQDAVGKVPLVLRHK